MIVALTAAILFGAAAWSAPPQAEPFMRTVTVVDGDTLQGPDGPTIRLWGIDAPSLGQTCTKDGETYPCGESSREVLAFLFKAEGSGVRCTPRGRPNRKVVVATCTTLVFSGEYPPTDLAAFQVEWGNAVVDPASSGAYAEPQAAARRERRGVWQGEFQMPWEWRGR